MLQRCRVLVVCTTLHALGSSSVYAADWRFSPSLQLKETFSDNIRLAPKGEEESDWVTEVNPGFSLTGRGARLQARADYRLKYRWYAKNSESSGFGHQLRSTGTLDVWERNLFLDASASITQQETTTLGPRSSSDVNLNDGLREVRTVQVSPYWVSRLGTFANLQARYTWSRSESDGSTDSLASNLNAYNVSLASGPQFQNLGWTASYTKQRIDSQRGEFPQRELESASLSASYRLLPTLAAIGSVGREENTYGSLGKTSGNFYTVGFHWTPSSRTSIRAEVGERYFGNTASLQAQHYTRLTSWTLSYVEQVVATPGRFTSDVAVDTAAVLDRLFLGAVPDPIEREAVVQAFIVANGLPDSLLSSVDFLTDQVTLSERLQGTMALRGLRGTLVITLYRENRRRESTGETVSGTDPFAITDEVLQTGYSAILSWRFSQQTAGTASFGQSTADHTDAGQKSTNTTFRVGLTHRFNTKLRGALQYRFTHDTNGSSPSVRENAVTGTLNIAF